MADWQALSSEEVYITPWIRVRRDEVLNHRGAPLTYSVVELRHPSVFIIASNERGEILLQRNFCYPVNKYMWDLPAGHSEAGETTLVAAKRELLEETGFASDDWTNLGTLHSATGIGDIPGDAFLARNVYAADGERDTLEDIAEQRFMSQSAIDEFIREGKLTTSITIAALRLAQLHNLKKEAKA